MHPAKRPNEYWQIDATVIRLTTGVRTYLQAVIDNFSRKILAWRGRCCMNTGKSLIPLILRTFTLKT